MRKSVTLALTSACYSKQSETIALCDPSKLSVREATYSSSDPGSACASLKDGSNVVSREYFSLTFHCFSEAGNEAFGGKRKRRGW